MNPIRNLLLKSLPSESLDRVRRRLEWIEMALKQSLAEPDEAIEHVYFPETGVCSVVMETDDDGIVEVATTGHEGFVNTPILLGTDRSAARVICQVPGVANRLAAADFRDAVESDAALRRTLLRFMQAYVNQIAQNASCNRMHNIEERAARWLLMTHDRVEGDTFPLTQEFLGQMLGVRRQAVNVAAGMLQQAGFINYVRGQITILDRKGLEGASCECYRVIRREFKRLIGI